MKDLSSIVFVLSTNEAYEHTHTCTQRYTEKLMIAIDNATRGMSPKNIKAIYGKRNLGCDWLEIQITKLNKVSRYLIDHTASQIQ